MIRQLLHPIVIDFGQMMPSAIASSIIALVMCLEIKSFRYCYRHRNQLINSSFRKWSIATSWSAKVSLKNTSVSFNTFFLWLIITTYLIQSTNVECLFLCIKSWNLVFSFSWPTLSFSRRLCSPYRGVKKLVKHVTRFCQDITTNFQCYMSQWQEHIIFLWLVFMCILWLYKYYGSFSDEISWAMGIFSHFNGTKRSCFSIAVAFTRDASPNWYTSPTWAWSFSLLMWTFLNMTLVF